MSFIVRKSTFKTDICGMNLILFDDPVIRPHLLPLTFTRPVADLRVGILTIAEKWACRLSPNQTPIPVSFLTEPYLQAKFPHQPGPDNLYINGAVCPTDALAEAVLNLALGESLIADNLLIAVRATTSPLLKQEGAKPLGAESQRLLKAPSCFRTGLGVVVFPEPITIIRQLWDIFLENPAQIRADFDLLTAGRTSAPITDPHTRCYTPEQIFLEPGATTKAAILNAEAGPIYLGKNAKVSEGAIVVGPFALGDGAEVAFGGKIRGGTTIGPGSKVGGEVNNAVIWGNSNKGHDGYLGNAVLGEWCNLGANVNNSNLKNDYSTVKMHSYVTNQLEDTGRQFCGLIMGDYTKAGISTMFNTGTIVGVSCNVFGGGFQPKHIPSFLWGGAAEGFAPYRFEKAVQVIRETQIRRNREFSTIDEAVLKYIAE
jgi:UDP-N-acetylglucosamine diphosphorylase / glucose-1-phosphate thymidylyltransferase / UDP-N-acetylgalactosamine diphosphorylase / glucosamine-1-phosphate N-acetyltransferase / galactosamine-1-phosphate N-acetyltransferase